MLCGWFVGCRSYVYFGLRSLCCWLTQFLFCVYMLVLMVDGLLGVVGVN